MKEKIIKKWHCLLLIDGRLGTRTVFGHNSNQAMQNVRSLMCNVHCTTVEFKGLKEVKK